MKRRKFVMLSEKKYFEKAFDAIFCNRKINDLKKKV